MPNGRVAVYFGAQLKAAAGRARCCQVALRGSALICLADCLDMLSSHVDCTGLAEAASGRNLHAERATDALRCWYRVCRNVVGIALSNVALRLSQSNGQIGQPCGLGRSRPERPCNPFCDRRDSPAPGSRHCRSEVKPKRGGSQPGLRFEYAI